MRVGVAGIYSLPLYSHSTEAPSGPQLAASPKFAEIPPLITGAYVFAPGGVRPTSLAVRAKASDLAAV